MCFQLPPTEVQSHLLPTFSRGALHGSIPDVFDGIFRKQPHQNQGGHMGTQNTHRYIFLFLLLLATQYDNHVQENITLCWVNSSGTNFTFTYYLLIFLIDLCHYFLSIKFIF